jgi:hypothetical protein
MQPIGEDDVCFQVASKRRKGFPSETGVKRGDRVVRGSKELIEKLGRNDLCPLRRSEVVSSAAACAAVAFDGVNRDHYQR